MKRTLAVNLALAAIVAALAALVYWKPHEPPPGYALSTLKPEAAASIRIERGGVAAIALEKKGDAWLLTEPFRARADAARVERLLEIVQARATHRMPAADLARFDLERPETRMTIDGESFGFGLVNEVSREQYVLAGGAVHTVHVRYGTALPGAAADMASRQLFAPSEMPVRIELKDFTVASRDGRWVLTPAPAEDLSQDDFNRWVDGWRRAIALRVEPYTRIRPQGEIKVELKDGAKLTLVILGRGADLALARSDEKLIYTFVSDVAKRLLSPPGAGVRSETADRP